MTTPQSEAALLPCPFPHEGRELLEEAWPAKGWYWVHCPCGATGPRVDSPEKARESWNKRSISEARAALADTKKIAADALLQACDQSGPWANLIDCTNPAHRERAALAVMDALRTLPAAQPTGKTWTCLHNMPDGSGCGHVSHSIEEYQRHSASHQPTGTKDSREALRAAGWSVAVHNDYRLNGEAMTFWLFTHPNGRYVKGEGRTDAEALSLAWQASRQSAAVPEALSSRQAEGWRDIATAPKDGQSIMIGRFSPGIYHYIHAASWVLQIEGYAYDGWMPWGWDDDPLTDAIQPTHWQPLPAAPHASLTCRSW